MYCTDGPSVSTEGPDRQYSFVLTARNSVRNSRVPAAPRGGPRSAAVRRPSVGPVGPRGRPDAVSAVAEVVAVVAGCPGPTAAWTRRPTVMTTRSCACRRCRRGPRSRPRRRQTPCAPGPLPLRVAGRRLRRRAAPLPKASPRRRATTSPSVCRRRRPGRGPGLRHRCQGRPLGRRQGRPLGRRRRCRVRRRRHRRGHVGTHTRSPPVRDQGFTPALLCYRRRRRWMALWPSRDANFLPRSARVGSTAEWTAG